MGEFEEKLNAVLSDPGAMEQIMALAKSLGGTSAPTAPPEERSTPPAGDGDWQPVAQAAAPTPPSPDFLGGIDPAMLQMGMELMQEYQRDSRSAALLEALRPFLQKERQNKLDRAVRLARLGRVVQLALNRMKRGDGDV